MLILPSPSTDALKKLLPHFYRQTGIKVNLAVYPYDEVFEILSHLHLHPYYDLLRIDMACFPGLQRKHYYRWSPSLLSFRYCWNTSLSKFNSTSA